MSRRPLSRHPGGLDGPIGDSDRRLLERVLDQHIDPEEVYRVWKGKPKLSPEQTLCLDMIRAAREDLRQDRESKQLDAAAWVKGSIEGASLTFELCCDILKLNESAVRDALLAGRNDGQMDTRSNHKTRRPGKPRLRRARAAPGAQTGRAHRGTRG